MTLKHLAKAMGDQRGADSRGMLGGRGSAARVHELMTTKASIK